MGDFEEDNEQTFREGSQKIIQTSNKFTVVHFVAFFLCTVIGREYMDWQPSLVQGFGQFMISQIIVAIAFIVLFLCLAEIWSAVPFSGGGYGLARALIGFYFGFLTGIAEIFTFVIHSAISADMLGRHIVEVAKLPSHASIGIVFAVYLAAVGLVIQPSNVVLRRCLVALASISVFILVFWLFGSLPSCDFADASLHHAKPISAPENWFAGGIVGYMLWFPYAAVPYAGACSFVLMTSFTKAPKQTMPTGVLIGSALIFCINVFVVFVNASLPDHMNEYNPMLVGWQNMFKLTFDASHHLADMLTIPSIFAQIFAYLLPCGALLQSFGRTKLLPSFMGLSRNKDNTMGTIFSASLGFFFCLLIHFEPRLDLYSICILCTVIAKVPAMYCYIKLKLMCPTLERGFVMPLGTVGAVFVMVVLTIMFIASAFFQENYFPIIVVSVAWAILSVYYYVFAARGQTLCAEEDKVFLMLHVKNFNRNKKARRHRGTRVQPSSLSNTSGVIKMVSPEKSETFHRSGRLLTLFYNLGTAGQVRPDPTHSVSEVIQGERRVADSSLAVVERDNNNDLIVAEECTRLPENIRV